MSEITGEVKAEITNGYINLCESFGINSTVGRIYTTLLLADRPFGLDDISKETGYSISTISKSMDISERIFDIHRFRNPGSKKVYFECEHSAMTSVRKAFLEVLVRNMEDIERIARKCEIKLDRDDSKEAQSYLRIIRKLRGDHETVIRLLKTISESYKFDESKSIRDR